MGSSRLQPGAASLPALQTSKLQLEDEDVLLPISYGTVAPADSASDSQQRQLATYVALAHPNEALDVG